MHRSRRWLFPILSGLALWLFVQPSAAAPVTFAFEGELTSLSSPQLEAALAQMGVKEGSPVRGTYTFESTAAPSGPAGQTEYAGAVIDFEIEIGSWRAAMHPAPSTDVIHVWSSYDLYRVRATGYESSPLIAPGSGSPMFEIFLLDTVNDPLPTDSLPLSAPDPNAWAGGATGSLFGDEHLLFNVHAIRPVIDSAPIERISRGIAPSPLAKDSYGPQLSGDGGSLVFSTSADTVVEGDHNGKSDVFLLDVDTGDVTLVSRARDGGSGDGSSGSPVISRDGNAVAFTSSAHDLVDGDINLRSDVFVWDRLSRRITRVNVDSAGNQTTDGSTSPELNDDGRWVAFASDSESLVLGDGNGERDVFVHDRSTGQTTRVSVSSFGTQSNGWSERPQLSGDGRYVAFDSYANNLVVGDNNDENDVFVRDRDTDADGIFDEPGAVATIRVSVSSSGAETTPWTGSSFVADISPDGRWVVFYSDAAGLEPGYDPDLQQVFVHDRDADADGIYDEPGAIETVLISRAMGAKTKWGDTEGARITDEGRFVSFSSDSDVLSTADTPGYRDVFVADRDTDGDGIYDEAGQTSITAISLPTSGSADGDSGGFTKGVTISGDGSRIAYESYASNLAPGDTNGRSDIFLFDGTTTTLVSQGAFGQSPNDNCETPVLSTDGRYVGHACYATNMLPGDDNQSKDVMRYDRATRTHEIASVDSAGVLANQESAAPSLSDDGQRMAFESEATNLVAGDNNAARDIFVRDFLTGTTERVSLSGGGAQTNDMSFNPSLSGDGRYVAFVSYANNLVAGDGNGYRDVFVKDTATGAVELVSRSSGGAQGNGESGAFRYNGDGRFISYDGRYVAFQSGASNLVGGDNNAQDDVFRHDRLTGTTIRVSVTDLGQEVDFQSTAPSISADGRYVAFASLGQLTAQDGNNQWDVYVRDTLTGTTELVSISTGGNAGNKASGEQFGSVSISADGNLVAFRSLATNLTPDVDANLYADLFIRDRAAGTTRLVSRSAAGDESDGNNRSPGMSPSGGHVVFESDAQSLVGDDQNGHTDLYLVPLVVDSDADGWPNAQDNCPTTHNPDQADGDGDGVGDVCDNCVEVPNASQEDDGGVGTTTPDGRGNRCQCGDTETTLPTDEGILNTRDSQHLLNALVGMNPGITAPEKCNVTGPADLQDNDGDGLPDDCDLRDFVVQARAVLGMGSVGGQCGDITAVAPGTSFTDELAAVFQAEQCTTCHSFTNPASGERLAHEMDGRLAPGVDVTDSANCVGCHNANTGFPADWRAAPSIMDWEGMNETEIGHLITANTPSPADMDHHFKNDERIFWALDEMGLSQNQWFAMADRWIGGGMRVD